MRKDRRFWYKLVALFLVLVLVAPVLVACGGGQTYTLIINTSPSGAGAVSPKGGEYDAGAMLTLTASPGSGYAFDHWGDAASGTNTTTTITMDYDKYVTAYFEAVYTLTVNVSPAGTGSVSPSGGQYGYGQIVTLRATPASGYFFDHWEGISNGNDPTTTIIMRWDSSVTAYFVTGKILTDGINSWRLESTDLGGRELETLQGVLETSEGWVVLQAEFEILSGLGPVRAWYQETQGGTTSMTEIFSRTGTASTYVTDSDGKAYPAVLLGMSHISFVVPEDSHGFTLYFLDWAPIELDY